MPSARERILDTASRLFYRHGFVSVGVDTITAEAGVAKMSLYRHFPSKDDLIGAYLERSNEQFWTWFDGALGEGAPRAQLMRLFDELAAQLLLLMDGAFVASRMFRSSSPAGHVGQAAAAIIKSATRRAAQRLAENPQPKAGRTRAR